VPGAGGGREGGDGEGEGVLGGEAPGGWGGGALRYQMGIRSLLGDTA